MAMRSLDTRKRNFLVSIFAKGGPEAKNAYFMRPWKGIYLMYAKSYRVWKGFFGKLQNMKVNMAFDIEVELESQVNMALQKWKATIYEASAARGHHQGCGRVARPRMLKEKFEKRTRGHSCRRRPTSVPSLIWMKCKGRGGSRILTRMLKIKQHGADSAPSVTLDEDKRSLLIPFSRKVR